MPELRLQPPTPQTGSLIRDLYIRVFPNTVVLAAIVKRFGESSGKAAFPLEASHPQLEDSFGAVLPASDAQCLMFPAVTRWPGRQVVQGVEISGQ